MLLAYSLADPEPFHPVRDWRVWKARGTGCLLFQDVYHILFTLTMVFMRNKDVCTTTPVKKCIIVQ